MAKLVAPDTITAWHAFDITEYPNNYQEVTFIKWGQTYKVKESQGTRSMEGEHWIGQFALWGGRQKEFMDKYPPGKRHVLVSNIASQNLDAEAEIKAGRGVALDDREVDVAIKRLQKEGFIMVQPCLLP